MKPSLLTLFLLITGFLPVSASSPPAEQQSLPSAPSQTGSTDFEEARRLSQQGKNAEALARLQTLAAAHSAVPGLSHELGIAYYKSGDYAKAIEALRKATQEDPKDNEAFQLLGLSNYLAGRPAEAIPFLEKVQG